MNEEKKLSFKTNLGWITCIEKNSEITSILFRKIKNIDNNPSEILKKIKKNLINYTKGKKIKFKNKITFQGTKLQIKIWKELQKIPYGQTKSYGEIAKILKTSPRYVGNVCGQNKHLIIVPCHRVIRSDGSPGGFSAPGGLKTKKKLLNFEKD